MKNYSNEADPAVGLGNQKAEMANPKQKSSAHRDKLTAPTVDSNGTAPEVPSPLVEAEYSGCQGARISLIIWFAGFSFLAVLMLWDLIAGLLFR